MPKFNMRCSLNWVSLTDNRIQPSSCWSNRSIFATFYGHACPCISDLASRCKCAIWHSIGMLLNRVSFFIDLFPIKVSSLASLTPHKLSYKHLLASCPLLLELFIHLLDLVDILHLANLGSTRGWLAFEVSSTTMGTNGSIFIVVESPAKQVLL